MISILVIGFVVFLTVFGFAAMFVGLSGLNAAMVQQEELQAHIARMAARRQQQVTNNQF